MIFLGSIDLDQLEHAMKIIQYPHKDHYRFNICTLPALYEDRNYE